MKRFNFSRLFYKHIINACEKSLQRLNRDYIDLYQLHSAKLEHWKRVNALKHGDLQKQGKIRYWGLSLNTFNPFPKLNIY
jgi:aryl-alcohol dehydrogenase-like predicted oxidoreductase